MIAYCTVTARFFTGTPLVEALILSFPVCPGGNLEIGEAAWVFSPVGRGQPGHPNALKVSEPFPDPPASH